MHISLSTATLVFFCMVTLDVTGAHAYSSGPPDGVAGEPPAFNTCSVCHGFAIGDGAVAILGLPPAYEAGAIYDLQVELQDPGQQVWGFELTVVDDATGEMAGTLAVVDGVHTQLSDNAGAQLDYLKQTSSGTYPGTPDGPVTWDFQWVAPVAGGDLTLYVAGNGANGAGGPGGDFIYATSESLGATTTAVDGAWVPVAIAGMRPAYPNPIVLGTSIPFELTEAVHVRIRVHDVRGRVVSELFDGMRPAGTYRVSWDGVDQAGGRAASGVYFIQLAAGGLEARQRVVVAR